MERGFSFPTGSSIPSPARPLVRVMVPQISHHEAIQEEAEYFGIEPLPLFCGGGERVGGYDTAVDGNTE